MTAFPPPEPGERGGDTAMSLPCPLAPPSSSDLTWGGEPRSPAWAGPSSTILAGGSCSPLGEGKPEPAEDPWDPGRVRYGIGGWTMESQLPDPTASERLYRPSRGDEETHTYQCVRDGGRR